MLLSDTSGFQTNNEGFVITGRLSVNQKSFSKTIGSFLWSNEMSFSLSDSKAYSFHLSVYRRDFDDENNFSGNYKGEIILFLKNKSFYFSVDREC